ncbi:MAG: hypothetical protein JNL57_10100 [Bacteroidetes bacterium]|nr:hypothetical protein [Bacteroidota bacterium]
MHSKSIPCALGLLAGSFFSATAQKTHILQFNPSAGDSFRCEMTLNANTVSRQKEQVFSFKMLNTTAYGMLVAGKTDSIYDLRYRYGYIMLDMEVVGTKVKIDTREPLSTEAEETEEMLYNVYRVMIGSEFGTLVSSTGRVIKLNGITEMKKRLLAQLKTDYEDNANYDRMRKTLEDLMDETNMKNQIEQSFQYYPSTPVSLKSKWSKKYTFNKGIQPSTGNFVLSEYLTDSMLRVDMNVKLQSDNNEGTPLKGFMKGYYHVSMKTGVPMYSQAIVELKGKKKVSGSGDVEVNSVTTVENRITPIRR